MTRAVTWLSWALVLGVLPTDSSRAEAWEGTLVHHMRHEVRDSQTRLGQNGLTVVVRWKLTMLMGEPMVYCDVTWFMRAGLGFRKSEVPRSVLQQIRFLPPRVLFVVNKYAQRKWYMTCDPGVLGAPQFIVPGKRVQQVLAELSKPARSMAAGYNVATAREIGRLFFYEQVKDDWVSAEDVAKRLAKPVKLSLVGLENVRFNLSALRAWNAKQELALAEKSKAKLLKQQAKSRKRAKKKDDRRRGASFWNSPQDKRTVKQAAAELKRRETVDAKVAAAARSIEKAKAEASRVIVELQRLRDSIANRPRPGAWREFKSFTNSGGLRGYKSGTGKVVIPARYRYTSRFRDGYAVVGVEASKRGVVSAAGVWVVPPNYAEVTILSATRFAVKPPGQRQFHLIDSTGKRIGSASFTAASPYRESLAIVSVGKLVGAITVGGKFRVQPRFSTLSNFTGGKAKFTNSIQYSGHCGSTTHTFDAGEIDVTGRVVAGPYRRTVSAPQFCLRSR